MIEFQFSKKVILVFSIALLFCVMALFHNAVNSAFEYSRAGISRGEIWRIVSAHVVHTNAIHGVMNAAAWVLIMGVVGQQLSWKRWGLAVFTMGVGISIFLFLWNPEIKGYVGFSGVLHGLLSLGLMFSVVVSKDKLHAVALVLFAAKIIREQLPGFNIQHLDHLIDAPVVVDAHLYGAILGVVMFCVYYAFDYLKSRDHSSNTSKVS